jgi:hypothetical protein
MDLSSASSSYSFGSIVYTRGRDWVVLPTDDSEILRLRPLSGGDKELSALHLGVEGGHIKRSEFPDPLVSEGGDIVAGKLLRDAAPELTEWGRAFSLSRKTLCSTSAI